MEKKYCSVACVLALLLVFGTGTTRAADQQSAANFNVLLSDGSTVRGAISFVIDLDTEYGMVQIPSASMVSARFDAAKQWADIKLKDAEMKLKYKAASSDIKATTSAGTMTIALAKVVTISNRTAAPPRAAYPATIAGQNTTAGQGQGQAGASAPPAAYAQQQPQANVAPPATVYVPQQPTVVYQYPPYQYVAPAPYYAPYYWPGPYVGWPYIGIGVRVGPRWGVGLRFR